MPLPVEVLSEIGEIRRLTARDLEPVIDRDWRMRRLRSAIEAQSNPSTASEVLTEIARTFLVDAAVTRVEKFTASLSRLLEVHHEIHDIYARAMTGKLGAPDLQRINELIPIRRRLLTEVSRLTEMREIETHGIEQESAFVHEVPQEEVTRRVRAKMAPGVPNDMVQAIPAQAGQYAPEQRAMLQRFDPDVAGQGFEVRTVLAHEIQTITRTVPRTTTYLKRNPIAVKFDGIMKTGEGTFRFLEAKFNDPALGSIYSEERSGEWSQKEGQLRDELGRQLAAIEVMRSKGYGCEGLTIVTNTEEGANAILGVILKSGFDRSLVDFRIAQP